MVIRQRLDETQEAWDERRARNEERNRLRRRLREATVLLIDGLDRNHFALSCLDRITRHVAQDGQSEEKISPHPLVIFPEKEGDEVFRWTLEVNEIERRLLDVEEQNNSLFGTLRRLTTIVVSSPQVVSDLTTLLHGSQRSTSCENGVQ